jgi:hypothetical protein
VGNPRRSERHPTSLTLVALAVASAVLFPTSSKASHREPPPPRISPFRQLTIVTVNAFLTDGKPSLTERSLELAEVLSSRPAASDGNYYAPDLIIINEIGPEQLTRLRDDLNEIFSSAAASQDGGSSHYEILGDSDLAKAKFLLNVEGIDASQASYRSWADDCKSDRFYQIAFGLEETASGATFTVAGVHLPTDYRDFLLPRDCRIRNIERLRSELASYSAPIVVSGDFNQRATETQAECDPSEANPPLTWWRRMTGRSDLDARSYLDAVRSWHRATASTLRDEWTHEQRVQTTLCNGAIGYRRNRIDYVFVSDSTLVHEAHADHPGWAGPRPGTISCDPLHPHCKYSDHRFVWPGWAFDPPVKHAQRPVTPLRSASHVGLLSPNLR